MNQTQRQDRLPAASQMPGLHAGFWMRVGAYMLDGIILSFFAIILYRLLLLPVGVDSLGFPLRIWPVVVFYAVLFPVQWLYFALFESSRHQATPGKRVLGIVVTDCRGQRIGFGRASGRVFAKILSVLTLDIGFLMAGWTLRKQALHDLIAGTFVVRKQGLEDFEESDYHGSEQAMTRALPTWAIVLICLAAVLFGLLPLASILAAIAIPLYFDSTAGPPVAQAVSIARRETALVDDYRNQTGAWPSRSITKQLNEAFARAMPLGRYIHKLEIVDCRGETCSFVVALRKSGLATPVAGKTFRLRTVNGGKTWRCEPAGGNPLGEDRLPASCRRGTGD